MQNIKNLSIIQPTLIWTHVNSGEKNQVMNKRKTVVFCKKHEFLNKILHVKGWVLRLFYKYINSKKLFQIGFNRMESIEINLLKSWHFDVWPYATSIRNLLCVTCIWKSSNVIEHTTTYARRWRELSRNALILDMYLARPWIQTHTISGTWVRLLSLASYFSQEYI